MVAEHEGKNKGERLAMLLVDMARHKCIHPDQISKSLSLLHGTKIGAI
jgi:hypothetical protein